MDDVDSFLKFSQSIDLKKIVKLLKIFCSSISFHKIYNLLKILTTDICEIISSIPDTSIVIDCGVKQEVMRLLFFLTNNQFLNLGIIY